METKPLGRVIVTAKVENLGDLYDVDNGCIASAQVRQVEMADAMVDTGSTMLFLPKRYIQQLGLYQLRTRKRRTSAGVVEFRAFSAVRLTIQGRDCLADVGELPDDCPPLIGQVPLELLDFWVDPIGQKLVGNPEHGGEHMLDVFHLGRS